ncbi:LacI family DNA-binding transcriptional regulator [Curtobacterium sp. PhB136]|uniref:LacI family DNA-binding transcriptional regulator n=1 Tax=Curtobacterium sp. PhB136 TaxID=2485181 RepID=UPI001053E898|nr:LacI family DNA-binding transcriptional regulator [Curtobacterium sp. PhB136]TCK64211.1 LacI family transcriptional regulator [Curtobacterium sp. PhB136]
MVTRSEDVARTAGVSRATVSQILNGRGARFSPATRERVERIALDLGYQPSVAARALATGSSDIVIALIPNTTFHGNLQDLFERATDELADRGLTLLLRFPTASAESLNRMVRGLHPRAVISFTLFDSSERELLERNGVLAVDPGPRAADDDVNRSIGCLQAEHLIEKGHQRLAFAHLHDARDDPFGQAREAGVRDACRAAGLPDPLNVSVEINADSADAALDSLAAPGVAIACYNDDVATALLAAGTRRGYRIPEDVALIGMDDTPLSAVTIPPLSTVHVDLESAARSSISRVIQGLGLTTTDPKPAENPLRVVVRGTT